VSVGAETGEVGAVVKGEDGKDGIAVPEVIAPELVTIDRGIEISTIGCPSLITHSLS